MRRRVSRIIRSSRVTFASGRTSTWYRCLACRIDEFSGEGSLGAIGAPSVGATSNGVLLIGLGAGQASLAATGNDATIDPAERLDDGRSGVDGGAVVELADSEGAVLAWKARASVFGGDLFPLRHRVPSVASSLPDVCPMTARLSAPADRTSRA